MSVRRASTRPPEGPLVQQLLAERRELKVAVERSRIELEDLRSRVRSDPRLRVLESENIRLREELAAARTERDQLRAAVAGAIAQMKKA